MYILFWILTIQRYPLSKPNEWIERQAKDSGYILETTLRLQRLFKEQFKQDRSHQANQRIREARGSTAPLGISTSDNIGERSMGDIVKWSPEFISI